MIFQSSPCIYISANPIDFKFWQDCNQSHRGSLSKTVLPSETRNDREKIPFTGEEFKLSETLPIFEQFHERFVTNANFVVHDERTVF